MKTIFSYGALPPTEPESRLAMVAASIIATHLSTEQEVQRAAIFDSHNGVHEFEVPTVALHLLVDVLAEFAVGNGVQIVPMRALVTTREAADLLNVSHNYLIGLLKQKKLPYQMTGKRRQIFLTDVLQYKKEQDIAARKILAGLADEWPMPDADWQPREQF